ISRCYFAKEAWSDDRYRSRTRGIARGFAPGGDGGAEERPASASAGQRHRRGRRADLAHPGVLDGELRPPTGIGAHVLAAEPRAGGVHLGELRHRVQQRELPPGAAGIPHRGRVDGPVRLQRRRIGLLRPLPVPVPRPHRDDHRDPRGADDSRRGALHLPVPDARWLGPAQLRYRPVGPLYRHDRAVHRVDDARVRRRRPDRTGGGRPGGRLLAGGRVRPGDPAAARAGDHLHVGVRVPVRVERVHPRAHRALQGLRRDPADLVAVLPAGPEGDGLGRRDGRGDPDRDPGDHHLHSRAEQNFQGHGCRSGKGLMENSLPEPLVGPVTGRCPRFQWRGFMIDSARTRFSVPVIKRVITLAARYGFNILHWHLTDDQGWRFEVPGYPRLTEAAYLPRDTFDDYHSLNGDTRERAIAEAPARWTNGYYSDAEIAEVVEHATCQGIEVVPEVDLPGHMMAAITA